MRRRDLLGLLAASAGTPALAHALNAAGIAPRSPYRGRLELGGGGQGSSVLILGAGLAGMVAAYELRAAGYQVRILEYGARAGGRCWTLRGGDTYVEMGGSVQRCEFSPGLYFNPGPWRIPYHHHALIDYCRRLGVRLEPFIQVNHNAWIHALDRFGGQPLRYRQVMADFDGHIAELLTAALEHGALEGSLPADVRDELLGALRQWGGLDEQRRYQRSEASAKRRGYDRDPGGGLQPPSEPSTPLALDDLLRSQAWKPLLHAVSYRLQTPLMQPVGGMDAIARAFAQQLKGLIELHARVTAIRQTGRQVEVAYEHTGMRGSVRTARADWCICTIPLPILNQIELEAGSALRRAIAAVPYAPSVKTGLQFRRRFWEQDEAIYGGISYTDQPIRLIAYPAMELCSPGPAVVLGGYTMDKLQAYELTALPPEQRIARAVQEGARIHPQYTQEFQNGISVAWHRNPATLGCMSDWSRQARREHYRNLCAIDGRLVLAGEHASYLPGWQEGAILSALDAIERVHARARAA